MGMSHRVNYRRRHSYSSRSNKTKLVKTPGGKLSIQYRTKRSSPPICPLSGQRLNGLSSLRPAEKKRCPKNRKSINRAYGAVLTHQVLRNRIIRAFLIEEERISQSLKKNINKKHHTDL